MPISTTKLRRSIKIITYIIISDCIKLTIKSLNEINKKNRTKQWEKTYHNITNTDSSRFFITNASSAVASQMAARLCGGDPKVLKVWKQHI